MSPATDKKKSAEPRRFWRDNIEAMAMAIIMAVMFKYFIVEAYKIPTGSMQPTLMGNDDTQIFDRIIVDKLSYHYRDPERFEVAVFKYPLDRSKNFIKRVCGMPGEDFAIRQGDLWARPDEKSDWKILRRPRPIQEEVWRRLDPDDPRFSSWKALDGARPWTITGRNKIEARGDGAVRLPNDNGTVFDNYRDGYAEGISKHLSRARNFSQRNPVGDLRLRGEVKALPGCKLVVIELREGARSYRFELPGPAAAADARVRIVAESKTDTSFEAKQASGSEAWRLPAGSSVEFAAQNMDDLLELEIDGDWVASLEIASASDQASSCTVRVEGEGADFDDVEIDRDIFYTEGSQGREFKIPPGNYVMLGDNTQDSSDAREWQFVKFRWPGPGSNDQWVRGNWYIPQNPIRVSGEPEGSRIFFRDEWGDQHNFLSPPGVQDNQLEPAPYVPRNLVVGRAVLVFWPQTIFGKLFGAEGPLVWRLKWVH